MLNGARLAAQQINDAGGLIGADGTVFQLTVVDTPPDNMNIALANMRQARVIAVLGPEEAELVTANMKDLQKLEVPVFTPATNDTLLLSDNSNRIFRSRAQKTVQINALADYLVNSLKIRSIRTIQLDSQSVVSLIRLANALAEHDIFTANHLYDEGRTDLDDIAETINRLVPDVVAIFGPPKLAAQAYNLLSSTGYQGAIVYDMAADPEFIEDVPADTLAGLISANTWSVAQRDSASEAFVLDYARSFGQLPDSISAASYDALQLIASVALDSGDMSANIGGIFGLSGVQGRLNPWALPAGETSANVTITRLNQYGRETVVARYRGERQLSAREMQAIPNTPTPAPTYTPYPTPTPAGYNLTINSVVQNIRSGPGLQYDVIGQLPRGSQTRVLGATADYSWFVVEFAGRLGWLAAYLVDTFGNPNLVPIIQAPSTPTPFPTATPPPPRDADLVAINAQPQRIELGRPTSVNITVHNQGLTAAGPFAVAATFEPGRNYAGSNLPGLGPGQQSIAQLNVLLNGPTGRQSVIIVVDLNNQVYEDPPGEANNNVYSYSYIADRPALTSGTWTLPTGTFDLDGNGNPDFYWTGSDLLALGSAGMYLMNGFRSFQDVYYDVIDISQAYLTAFNFDLLPNAIIGMVTADGNRAAVHIAHVERNGPITIEYRTYS